MTTVNKAERFKRLAEKRVNRAIKDLRLVANLANRNNYQYEQDQVETIMRALRRELQALGEKFNKQAADEESPFSL